jgi:MFS family permease
MYGFFSLAFTPLVVAYPVEIWPYQLRSRDLATMLMSTVTAVFFNIFVNPIALDSIQWRYYLVFVFILAGGSAIIYFVFPETRGHSLEEMALVFGDEETTGLVEGEIAEKIAHKGTSYHADEVNTTPEETA